MSGTRGSGIVSSAADVLWMNVVRGMWGVCEMCMYLAWGGLGGEWMRGLGLGVTNRVRTGGVLDVCLCFSCGGVGGEGGKWVGGLNQGLRCTQCSILLHLMDICFQTCICL